MSNIERPFNERLYRRAKIIELGISALERSILFPLVLKQSLQPLPEQVKLAYEQYKPLIADIYGEDHLKDDYLYHGTGRYHYLPEKNHKYESSPNGKTIDLLKQIFSTGLEPQQDVWVPTPASTPTVSLTNQRFYSRWYADRHDNDQLLWRYGNSTDWAFLFTVRSISKLLEIPYIYLLIRNQSDKKVGLLGSAQSWVSDVRNNIDSDTSYLDVWKSSSTIPNNFGAIIVTKKSNVPTYDFPLLRKSEKRTLQTLPPDKFTAVEVPLKRIEETKRLLVESGFPNIAVLPMECVDLHMSRFPLAELTKMEQHKKVLRNKHNNSEQYQLDFSPLTLDQLKQISINGISDSYSPYKLLAVMNQSPVLKALFSQISSWEGFTIHYHTLSGLLLFEKYFGHLKTLPGGVEKDFFRIFFSLHDIGDSLSSTTKGKLLQNQTICTKFLSQMGFKEKEIVLAKALLSDDPLGSFLKKAGILTEISFRLPQPLQPVIQRLSENQLLKLFTETGQRIKKMADEAEMNYDDFFDLLSIFHMTDAGTYTSEGGTVGSLNYVFSFDKTQGRMNYSSLILPLVEQLKIHTEN